MTPSGTRRVVITNPWVPPYVRRGSETVMVELASWLNAQGLAAELLGGGPTRTRGPARTRSPGGDTKPSADAGAIPVRAVLPPLRRAWPGGLDRDASLVPSLARELRHMPPAVIHSFHYVDATAARLAGLPYIATCQGIPLTRSFAGKPLHRLLLRAGWASASILTCPSRAAAAHLRAAFGLHADVVANGIEVSRYSGLDEERQAGLIVCAATPGDLRKRAEVLIDAFGLLARRMAGTELVFVAGPISDERRIELTGRLDPAVARRIRFLGQVPRDELVRWYARASVTCLPSLHEAFGMVLVESLAAGTPVVGTDHGAIPEIVSAGTGMTFPPDDARACARALAEVLSWHPDQQVAEACRARAGTYDWSVIGPQFLSRYERIGL